MFLKLQKKKTTACAAKSVLRTVHTYPSAEVFLRSMRKWGRSFAEVFFIKCSHHVILGRKRFKSQGINLLDNTLIRMCVACAP